VKGNGILRNNIYSNSMCCSVKFYTCTSKGAQQNQQYEGNLLKRALKEYVETIAIGGIVMLLVAIRYIHINYRD